MHYPSESAVDEILLTTSVIKFFFFGSYKNRGFSGLTQMIDNHKGSRKCLMSTESVLAYDSFTTLKE